MVDIPVLDVLLHQEPVGTLTLLSGDRALFSFNDFYINDTERGTLSLSFRDQYRKSRWYPSMISTTYQKTCAALVARRSR